MRCYPQQCDQGHLSFAYFRPLTMMHISNSPNNVLYFRLPKQRFIFLTYPTMLCVAYSLNNNVVYFRVTKQCCVLHTHSIMLYTSELPNDVVYFRLPQQRCVVQNPALKCPCRPHHLTSSSRANKSPLPTLTVRTRAHQTWCTRW